MFARRSEDESLCCILKFVSKGPPREKGARDSEIRAVECLSLSLSLSPAPLQAHTVCWPRGSRRELSLSEEEKKKKKKEKKKEKEKEKEKKGNKKKEKKKEEKKKLCDESVTSDSRSVAVCEIVPLRDRTPEVCEPSVRVVRAFESHTHVSVKSDASFFFSTTHSLSRRCSRRCATCRCHRSTSSHSTPPSASPPAPAPGLPKHRV